MASRSIRCVTQGLIAANTENYLIDVSSMTDAVLPAQAVVNRVYVCRKSTLTGNVALSIGYDGAPEALLASSAGLTTDDVVMEGIYFHLHNVVKGLNSDKYICIKPAADIYGQIEIYIEYIFYSDLQ